MVCCETSRHIEAGTRHGVGLLLLLMHVLLHRHVGVGVVVEVLPVVRVVRLEARLLVVLVAVHVEALLLQAFCVRGQSTRTSS